MDWKEFLKPDWRKILIFVPLVVYALAYSNLASTIEWFSSVPLSYLSPFLNPFPAMYLEFNLFKVSSSLFPIFYLILPVPYTYFVSCLIVRVYEALRRK